MGIGRIVGLTTIVLVGAASAGGLYAKRDDLSALFERKLEGVRKPLFTEAEISKQTSTFALPPSSRQEPAAFQEPVPVQVASANGPIILPRPAEPMGDLTKDAVPAEAPQRAALEAPPSSASMPSQDAGEAGDVTAKLESPGTPVSGERGIVILQIGDSHTSADFLTGELRRRLQARYGSGAPGYVTAGHPHIGVRSSSLKVTASGGWTYKSLQKRDAVPAEFWLSGYNSIATTPGATMTFASDRPVNFEMIEIETLRQPGGGKIDVKLDGVVETSYELASPKTEPVVIRLLPTRAATETVKEVSITTTGRGPVSIASVAIYNKQTGITFNSIGYPGAQASFVNKFSNKLLANDLLRINPHIVILSFGTNEAANDHLDLAHYRSSYENVVGKIKSTLPEATIVVIGPPDYSELTAACRKEKDRAACGRSERTASATSAANSSGCAWRTPPMLNRIREVQRDIAERNGLVYWNWASIMPQECGAHRWYTASPQLMAKDHVHFTFEGYKKSADQFLRTLIPVIEKVRVGANVISHN
jgi:lysophospholipase L1-like esterase